MKVNLLVNYGWESDAAPRNSQGRPISWSPSSVRSLLFRRLYLGKVI